MGLARIALRAGTNCSAGQSRRAVSRGAGQMLEQVAARRHFVSVGLGSLSLRKGGRECAHDALHYLPAFLLETAVRETVWVAGATGGEDL